MDDHSTYNGSPRVYRRVIGSDDIADVYLTAAPPSGSSIESQARQVYSELRRALLAEKARCFSERLFATAEAIPTIDAVRREVFGDLDDGVAPTRIVVSPSPNGSFAGAQVHAVRTPDPPVGMRCWETAESRYARLLDCAGTAG